MPGITFSETLIERLDGYLPRYCHAVVRYFDNRSTAVATVDDLASAICDRQDEPERRVAIRLHHSTLPKLAETGLLEYDPRSNTVRYRGDVRLEQAAQRRRAVEDNEE